MKQISKKERFYLDLGEAMFMNNMRGFILEENASDELKEKIKLLPSVFKAEW